MIFFTLNKNFMMYTSSKFYVKKQNKKPKKKTKQKQRKTEKKTYFNFYLISLLISVFLILYSLVGLCSFLDFLQWTKGKLSFFTEKLGYNIKVYVTCGLKICSGINLLWIKNFWKRLLNWLHVKAPVIWYKNLMSYSIVHEYLNRIGKTWNEGVWVPHEFLFDKKTHHSVAFRSLFF